MVALWAFLPADDATVAYARLDALARDLPGDDPRRIDARRADILTDLLLGRDVPGAAQTSARRAQPLKSVAVPARGRAI